MQFSSGVRKVQEGLEPYIIFVSKPPPLMNSCNAIFVLVNNFQIADLNSNENVKSSSNSISKYIFIHHLNLQGIKITEKISHYYKQHP